MRNSRLKAVTEKRLRRTLGLMSGTSADGVDIALCDVDTDNRTLRNVKSLTVPYTAALRETILMLAQSGQTDLSKLALISTALGHFYADAIENFLSDNRLTAAEIDLIGSHGQTVVHIAQPEKILGMELRATLQIGEAEVIAKRVGVVTVADFRQGDITVGGSGAPLTPVYHRLRFAKAGSLRVVVNIGGIANITILDGDTSCQASDSGPGNCLVDHWVKLLFGSEFDENGEIADSGKIDDKLLSKLKGASVFQRALPTSCDRKEMIDMLDRYDVDPDGNLQSGKNLITTLSELTVWSIADTINKLTGERSPDAVLVCGGGVFNRYLMRRLRDHFADSKVETTDRYGSDPRFVEAEAFAYLANLTIDEVTGNLTAITGASREVILGKISLP